MRLQSNLQDDTAKNRRCQKGFWVLAITCLYLLSEASSFASNPGDCMLFGVLWTSAMPLALWTTRELCSGLQLGCGTPPSSVFS